MNLSTITLATNRAIVASVMTYCPMRQLCLALAKLLNVITDMEKKANKLVVIFIVVNQIKGETIVKSGY